MTVKRAIAVGYEKIWGYDSNKWISTPGVTVSDSHVSCKFDANMMHKINVSCFFCHKTKIEHRYNITKVKHEYFPLQ